MNENPEFILPTIPEKIVVHLGPPDAPAPNIEIGFVDYLTNVASNEVYPTWPEEALVANIIAQATFALNRIYTEFYRSKGYDFDITSSTAFDQAFVPNGSSFENIAMLTDRYFNSYIRRENSVEPLFALYCDGVNTTCAGLSQTGTVELANRGLTPFEILQYYYGEDIVYVEGASVAGNAGFQPNLPVRLGSVGNEVRIVQSRLNRISANYPSIPKIFVTDGFFGPETEQAVRAFQRAFGMKETGEVDSAVWYEIRDKYNAVKKLNDLFSEGVNFDEVSLQFKDSLQKGDTGIYVAAMQYFLNFVSAFTTDFTDVPISGTFDEATKEQVLSFQNYAGLPVTGIMDEQTWNVLFDQYRGIVESLPDSAFEGIARPFPGFVLRIGNRGEDVRTIQEYINVLANRYDSVPEIAADGIYGPETRDAVYAIQSLFGLTVDGDVDPITWARIGEEYNDIVAGALREDGQFPGYDIE